jgi:hypothetical protein
MRQKVLTFALSTALLTLVFPSSYSAEADEPSGDSLAVVYFASPSLGVPTGSVSAYRSSPDENGRYYGKSCSDGMPGFDGVSSFECGTTGFNVLNFWNSLSPCSLSASVSCIESLEIQSSDGGWSQARYAGQPVSPATNFPAFPQIDVGPSSTGALYEFDVDGSKELILLRAPYFKLLKTPILPKYNIEVSRVQPPVVVNASEFFPTGNSINPCLVSGSGMTVNGITTVNTCWKRKNEGARYRLTLKLMRKPSGWVNTQIGDAKLSITKGSTDAAGYSLVLEGDSVVVPESGAKFYSSISSDHDAICTIVRWSAPGFCGSKMPGNASLYPVDVLNDGARANPVEMFSKLLAVKPELNKALSDSTVWRAAIRFDDLAGVSNCVADGITGLVGGNALAVEASIPKWNKSKASLEYKVTAPHFRSNGEVATGIYELQINEKVAKCLWGVALTPQNVQISVIDNDGNAKVAVAVLSTYSGMIKFRATGFTYSNATLRVSLKSASKSAGLVCVKGSQKRTVKTSASKCPSGWRKVK